MPNANACKKQPRYKEVAARAKQLLADGISKTDVVDRVEGEFGTRLTKAAVGNWYTALVKQSTGRPPTQSLLSHQQEARIELDEERIRRRIAQLPHRCSNCLGTSSGDLCEWCGHPFEAVA